MDAKTSAWKATGVTSKVDPALYEGFQRITYEEELSECPSCGAKHERRGNDISSATDFQAKEADRQREVETANAHRQMQVEQHRRSSDDFWAAAAPFIFWICVILIFYWCVSCIRHDEYLGRQPNANTTNSLGNPPGNDIRQLSSQDLQSKTAKELDLLRNEIYARHGFRFGKRRPDLTAYFSKQPWYHPDSSDQEVVFERLNPNERRNVEVIKAAEAKMRHSRRK